MSLFHRCPLRGVPLHSRDGEGVNDGPEGLDGRGEGGVAGGDDEHAGVTEEAGEELEHVVGAWWEVSSMNRVRS